MLIVTFIIQYTFKIQKYLRRVVITKYGPVGIRIRKNYVQVTTS